MPLTLAIVGWTTHSVISDSMQHKPKGIPSRESTQPIKIQEEGIRFGPTRVFSSRYFKSLQVEDFSQAWTMLGCHRRVVPLIRSVYSRHSGRIAARAIHSFRQY